MVDKEININLESLIELSASLNQNYDEKYILNSALLTLMGKLKITSGIVMVPDDDRKFFNVIIIKGKQDFSKVPFFRVSDLRKLNKSAQKEIMLRKSGFIYCVPIIYNDNILALICLGNRLSSNPLSEQEQHYSKLVATITANALQNTKNHLNLISAYNNLEVQNLTLTTLYEISRDFSTLLSRNQILQMLSLRLMGQLMVSRFAVILFDGSNNYDLIINRFEKNIPNHAIKNLSIVKTTSTIEDLAFNKKSKEFFLSIDCKIISPLVVQGYTRGFIIIGKKMGAAKFSNDNLKFIEALGNTAIAALENERLFQEEIEKKRIENELSLALEIQTNLMPKKTPVINNYDIFGISIPSRHVGGDYYDYIEYSDGKYLISIADVSGKGMPAALLMANLQAALKALAPLSLTPDNLCARLNNIVFNNTTPDKFVTFFCGILNPVNHEFIYVNAGHNPPILLKSDGEIIYLSEGGLILGFSDLFIPYKIGSVYFDKGDILLLYTDGVTEARNINGEEFSEAALVKHLSIHEELSSKKIIISILDSLNKFVESENHEDDITMVSLKRIS